TQSATHSETKKAPMFTRLRTLRFMKVRSDAGGVTVGFDGIAARIARIHQYGLQDEVGPGTYAQYPTRELLGMTPADLVATENAVISSLGGAS
ncbi:TPA: phage virion morphogenesis protein, partial [Klebsiella oxytoca]|nr:phage virion morphogenesis protein [Klebsiella oxytoca]